MYQWGKKALQACSLYFHEDCVVAEVKGDAVVLHHFGKCMAALGANLSNLLISLSTETYCL